MRTPPAARALNDGHGGSPCFDSVTSAHTMVLASGMSGALALLAAFQMVASAEVVWQMGSKTMQVAVSSDGSYVFAAVARPACLFQGVCLVRYSAGVRVRAHILSGNSWVSVV
eukprot:COSAG02_NODE_1351_length_13108_cov_7.661465_12_plen_113_part_00